MSELVDPSNGPSGEKSSTSVSKFSPSTSSTRFHETDTITPVFTEASHGAALETASQRPVLPVPGDIIVDIEHTAVVDDPRGWSWRRKALILAIISGAAMIAGLGSNIYNPALSEIESDLHASSSELSLSLALFILIQGTSPIAWSALSEIKGRKIVYIISVSIGLVGCIVAAEARSIGVLIGMRCAQAIGGSSVMSLGAATLADIYEPSVRGTMMGVYISAPLLGPALGPIIGGLLTQYFSWRATFWFLAIFMGGCLLAFVGAFRDTFRKERSVAYQVALGRVISEMEHERERNIVEVCEKDDKTVVGAGELNSKDLSNIAALQSVPLDVPSTSIPHPVPSPACSSTVTLDVGEVKLSIRDVNPIPPLLSVLSRWNNLIVLIASGLDYGFAYSISYTCALTLSNVYNYNALQTGLVLIPYGVGNIIGSILGGRWSDHVLRQWKPSIERGGHVPPEVRIRSTIPAMCLLPPCVLAYAWLAEERIHIASICVVLFFIGFFSIWIYTSTLSYIVDANVGRSGSAVATNSAFRGSCAFVFAEIVVPIQDAIGDGGLYTLWAGLIAVLELLLLVVLYKGDSWRKRAEEREERKRQKLIIDS